MPMTFELTSPDSNHDYVRLADYCQAKGLDSTRQVAKHFDIAQTTATRWMKNDELWVITEGFQGPWLQVYVEKILRTRGDVAESPGT